MLFCTQQWPCCSSRTWNEKRIYEFKEHVINRASHTHTWGKKRNEMGECRTLFKSVGKSMQEWWHFSSLTGHKKTLFCSLSGKEFWPSFFSYGLPYVSQSLKLRWKAIFHPSLELFFFEFNSREKERAAQLHLNFSRTKKERKKEKGKQLVLLLLPFFLSDEKRGLLLPFHDKVCGRTERKSNFVNSSSLASSFFPLFLLLSSIRQLRKEERKQLLFPSVVCPPFFLLSFCIKLTLYAFLALFLHHGSDLLSIYRYSVVGGKGVFFIASALSWKSGTKSRYCIKKLLRSPSNQKSKKLLKTLQTWTWDDFPLPCLCVQQSEEGLRKRKLATLPWLFNGVPFKTRREREAPFSFCLSFFAFFFLLLLLSRKNFLIFLPLLVSKMSFDRGPFCLGERERPQKEERRNCKLFSLPRSSFLLHLPFFHSTLFVQIIWSSTTCCWLQRDFFPKPSPKERQKESERRKQKKEQRVLWSRGTWKKPSWKIFFSSKAAVVRELAKYLEKNWVGRY